VYLPYAHTDFIFRLLAKSWSADDLGRRVCLRRRDCPWLAGRAARGNRFGLLLGCGIISLLGWQAAVNIGVTTSLIPNKGLPLPFISYGGSNLVACLFGIGLLLSIYRQAVFESRNQKRQAMPVRITPRI
jgi:cell division protein FtsW